VTAVTIRFLPEGAAKLWGVAGTTVRTSATNFLRDGAKLTFRRQRLRIDARTQALAGLVRHSLSQNIAEPLEPGSVALTKVQRAVGPRTTHTTGASIGRQRLVDRVKLVLASDLARRWTSGEVGAEVRGSAVYLTHVFQQAEGLPLYRYHWRELLTFWCTMTA
jgi:hypothetical protein